MYDKHRDIGLTLFVRSCTDS